MTSVIQYTELQNLLGDRISASEAHGMLIAFLCADQNQALSLWVKELSDLTEDALDEGAALVALYEFNREVLKDINFSLELLLPEEERLSVRAPALINWCHGFLYGIGITKMALDGDALEFTNDLIEFTRMSFDLDEGEDEGKTELLALEEIVEFVRMGAILVYHHSLTK